MEICNSLEVRLDQTTFKNFGWKNSKSINQREGAYKPKQSKTGVRSFQI